MGESYLKRYIYINETTFNGIFEIRIAEQSIYNFK